MKPEHYNPKAREAFGRSLIEIGVAIFKGIILLFTVVPLAAVLGDTFHGHNSSSSILAVLTSVSATTQFLTMALLIVGFIAGFYFRKEGLRHLHELETDL